MTVHCVRRWSRIEVARTCIIGNNMTLRRVYMLRLRQRSVAPVDHSAVAFGHLIVYVVLCVWDVLCTSVLSLVCKLHGIINHV